MDNELYQRAQSLGQALSRQGLKLVTAESCTGGWIAKAVTDVPGSSDWFDRGFVTYGNDAKADMLGVEMELLDQFGAVSEPVVREMALGALANSPADVAVAVSGIAGPGGGSAEKPVGTVWFAWALPGQDAVSRREIFSGDREQVRRASVAHAMKTLVELLG